MTDDISKALAPLTEAQRMLSAAVSLEDFRNLRDYAETARAYAKARGLGIDSENLAAEYVLRAERGMGATLVQMAADGTRAARGQNKLGSHGMADVVTTADLGLRRQDAQIWQRLATMWTDDQFESNLAAVKATGARLTKVDFYRGPKRAEERDRKVIREAAIATVEEAGEYGSTGTFAAFERVATPLIQFAMAQLPNDELAQMAVLIRDLATAYNAVKAMRS